MKAEERKVLKEKLKKQIDELSDEELEQIAGGDAIDDWINNHQTYECPYCKKVFYDENEKYVHMICCQMKTGNN